MNLKSASVECMVGWVQCLHTLCQMGDGIVKTEQMMRNNASTDEIDDYIVNHELNVHFTRNAALTIAVLKAVENPNVFYTV